MVSAAQHDDPGVLGEQEQREAQPGVLGVRAEDDLRVGDRHVERRPLQLGEPGGEEDQAADELPEQPPPVPRLDDARAATACRRPSRREAAASSIGSSYAMQLGGRAQAAEQRELVGARPSRPSASRARRRPSRPARRTGPRRASCPTTPCRARPGSTISTSEVREQGHGGRELEDPAVGVGRDHVLLLRELHAVGDELGPAVEAAGVHRAEPALHVRHHLVLGLARRAAAGPGRPRGRRPAAGRRRARRSRGTASFAATAVPVGVTSCSAPRSRSVPPLSPPHRCRLCRPLCRPRRRRVPAREPTPAQGSARACSRARRRRGRGGPPRASGRLLGPARPRRLAGASPRPALRVRRAGTLPRTRSTGPAPRASRAGDRRRAGAGPSAGPTRSGRGRRAAASGAAWAPPSSDSPGSFAPGHALATRAASTKSLRSGWPSKLLGQQQRRRAPGARSKPMPNISCVSRSCQAAPA